MNTYKTLAIGVLALALAGCGGGGGSSQPTPNPTPTLASLAPSSALAGSAAQTLTINGTNFVSSATVTYNGAAHTANFISSTQLTISLSASDQAAARTYPVVVTNPAPGGGASNSISFTVNDPVPAITSLSPSSTPAESESQTLTIKGSSFVSSSTVTYNGTARAAMFVSSTELTISLSAGDQTTVGTYPVIVTNPAPGGGTSKSISFTVNQPVSIDAQAPAIATVNKDIFGANLTATMNLTTSNGYYNTMIATFQNANFGMVRWPLALVSDYFHWETNSVSSCFVTAYGPLTIPTTFDQFMQQVAQPLGLNVNITINYGSNATCTGGGDPSEAAAWVDYANNQMHYGIKYWTIGNEQYYGSPTLGASLTTPDFNVSASAPGSAGSATYANLIATQFYPLMKAQDPSIQVGVDLVVPNNSVSSRTAPWDSTVLANAKFDFVEVHWYGDNAGNVAISDSALLTSGVSYFVSALAQLQSELVAAGKANTPIFVGEWGVPGPNGGSPQSISIVGALYTALVLGELTKGGIGMAGVWSGFDSGPCVPSPPGDYSWQSWFTSSLFEAIAGGTNPACPLIMQPPVGTAFPRADAIHVVEQAFNAGDTVFVPAVSSSLATLRAYAARRASGYGLLLVNTDQNNPVTTTVGIVNDTRTFTASSLVYGKAQYDNSKNNVWTTPVSQSLGTVTGSLSITVPQWSITAITLSAP
jgi:hypothetical protein